MRMNEQGEKAQSTETKLAEEEVTEKRDPSLNNFYKWINWFMRPEYGRANPEISIFARTLARLKMIPVTNPRKCPMMAVSEQQGHHVLWYNPKWMAHAGYLEFVATLCHEALHILLFDIPKALNRMAMLPADKRQKFWRMMNVALDAANNDQLVEQMPHMRHGTTGEWVLPEQMGMKRKQDMEHYFEILLMHRKNFRNRVDEMKRKYFALGSSGDEESDEDENEEGESDGSDDQGQGQMPGVGGATPDELDEMSNSDRLAYAMALLETMNAHDWTDQPVEQQSAEELEAKASMLETEAKSIAKDAIESHEKQCGNVPQRFRGILDDIKDGKLPWTELLSRLVQARMLGKRKLTETHPSKKRYIMFRENEDGELERLEVAQPIFPGSKRDRTFVIMYAIDTSGSMSDDEVKDGLSEIQSLLKTYPDAHCIVVQCDVMIADVSILGPEEDLDQYVKRVGRASVGGTRFDQPFQLAQAMSGMNEFPEVPEPGKMLSPLFKYEGIDMVVYHTDGYAPAPPITVRPPCPVIWVLTENGTRPGTPEGQLFGSIIER